MQRKACTVYGGVKRKQTSMYCHTPQTGALTGIFT